MCGLAFVSTVLLVVAYYVQTARSRILADPLRPAMAALPFAQLRVE